VNTAVKMSISRWISHPYPLINDVEWSQEKLPFTMKFATNQVVIENKDIDCIDNAIAIRI